MKVKKRKEKKKGCRRLDKVLEVKKECEEDEERKKEERNQRQEGGIEEYLNLISWHTKAMATMWTSLVQSHLYEPLSTYTDGQGQDDVNCNAMLAAALV